MASQYSSASSEARFVASEVPDCKHGVRATWGTTRREKENFMRRFYRCRYYGTSKDCRFFAWMDDEFSDRAKEVITNFRKKEKGLEDEIKGLKVQVTELLCATGQGYEKPEVAVLVLHKLESIQEKISELKVYVIVSCCFCVTVACIAAMFCWHWK